LISNEWRTVHWANFGPGERREKRSKPSLSYLHDTRAGLSRPQCFGPKTNKFFISFSYFLFCGKAE
jgi:hypothetical protein